jgi:TATA-binding protein-associated factor
MRPELLQQKEREQQFLEQLLYGSTLTPYSLPITLKEGLQLRKYQQEGVNWLAFLKKYNLHGILCDGKHLFFLSLLN